MLLMWAASFIFNILNPTSGVELWRDMSVAGPGLIGTLYGFRFRGED